MVGFGNIIKIGDFGLARTLQNNDYYRFQRRGRYKFEAKPDYQKEGFCLLVSLFVFVCFCFRFFCFLFFLQFIK